MLAQRPYLVKAIYHWIVDSGYTPHILVNAHAPGVEVPQDYVEEGEIVLNISDTAAIGLSMDGNLILFEARFAGVPMRVRVPMLAVVAIYANENGRGMVFGPDSEEMTDDSPTPPATPAGPSSKGCSSSKASHLRIVK